MREAEPFSKIGQIPRIECSSNFCQNFDNNFLYSHFQIFNKYSLHFLKFFLLGMDQLGTEEVKENVSIAEPEKEPQPILEIEKKPGKKGKELAKFSNRLEIQ